MVAGLIVFSIFYFLARPVRRVVKRIAGKNKKHHNLGRVMGRLSQAGMLLAGFLIAMVIAVPSFKPGQLVQLLGIGGVAIGFAFRDILQNFLAGILLLLTEPFKVGDQIVVNDYEGTVEDIMTRATFIKTYDGRRVVIPNSDLFTNSVTVNTAYPIRRMQYDFGIGYGDDIDKAKKIIEQTLHGIPDVLKDPAPDVLTMDLAAHTVNLRARWWIEPPKRSEANASLDKVLSGVKKALSEGGIDLPFPTQTVLFHDQTDEFDGDRSRQREGWPAGRETPKSLGMARSFKAFAEKFSADGENSESQKDNVAGRESRMNGDKNN
ncbi:MAG: mechanosensitive ion channel family protein [Verrucomicrobiales bacterium]